MKTLGGRQFWGDLVYCHGWRIQKNVLTGHHRLLDPDDFRFASGSREECEARLKEIKKAKKLGPMSGKAAILIHGIIRSSKSFHRLAENLKEEGYTVVGFDYPSTRVDIAEAAGFLDSVIRSLEGIEEIHIVAHSMGGLVTRQYVKDHGDERIKRLLMIATPNQGAHLADFFKKNLLFKAVMGPAGQQLVSDPEGFIADLPTPEFEFGIIAGGRGNRTGYNPLLAGDDDGTITVACTRLPGAADFVVVSGLHSFLPANKKAVQYAVRFLKTGRFREQGEPHPIPKADR